jgi:nucleoside-diphosphate-sugar epimerase
MKVVVTGANGKIGTRVMEILAKSGYNVMGIDREVFNLKKYEHRVVDLLHEGQVYQTLSNSDAVIHLASYPRPNIVPDTLTFQNNVNSIHNILNSCFNLNIHKVIIASSMASYGFRYSNGRIIPKYFPVDEEHPCDPVDSYGLSKVVGEKIADSFAHRSNMSIISLRIPQVLVDYGDFEDRSKNPSSGKDKLWLYIDIRDVAKAFLNALESAVLGHEIMNISAADSDQLKPSVELIKEYFPNSEMHEDMLTGNESLLNIQKARNLIGFVPEFSWRRISGL